MTILEVPVCQGCGGELPELKNPGNPRKWCSDRCRKRQYGGRCVECGRRTDGSNGRGGAPERCLRCGPERQHRERVWTPEAVARALREWAHELGRSPTAPEALRKGARVPASAVQREFGSWNKGLQAAGLRLNRKGVDLAVCREIRERYEAGGSPSALAAAYGCSSSAILYRVVLAGGRPRDLSEANRLAWTSGVQPRDVARGQAARKARSR